MTNWIALTCPACGAGLEVAGNHNRFSCGHCGTSYLLAKPVQDIGVAERSQLRPLTTYTHQLTHWHPVGEYEIFVHTISEELERKDRVLFIDAEYRNPGTKTLSCRRNQWVLFDTAGFTYDPASDTALFSTRSRPAITGERFLNPGMNLRGWVAFKLAPALQVARLQFLTGFLQTSTVEYILTPQ